MIVNICDDVCENVGCIAGDSDRIKISWSEYIRDLVLKNSWLFEGEELIDFQ